MKLTIKEPKELFDKIPDALDIIANLCVTDVQQTLRDNKSVVTGNLLNSIKVLDQENNNEVRIGTNVVYAPRLEFGFVDVDSLGRHYNQAPKPYLRSTLERKKNQYVDLLRKLLNDK